MAKQYKIRRSKYSLGSHHKGPGALKIILTLFVVGVLGFIGYAAYQPIYNFLTADRTVDIEDISIPDPAPSTPDAQDMPVTEPDPEPPAAMQMQTVYMPDPIARDPALRAAFIDELSGSSINAVMVDIKDVGGEILFNTTNENAIAWGAVVESPLDLKALAVELEQKGYSLVVRMSAFRDSIASSANRDIAIRYRDTQWHWLDAAAEDGGKPWLNPYSEGAREYIASIAEEAVDAGAKMVVFVNMHFPVGSEANANFGAGADSVTRAQVLSDFMQTLSDRMEPKEARCATYITALSTVQDAENRTRYGGSPFDVVADTVVVGALPYQFGADYTSDYLTISNPIEDPASVTSSVLTYFKTQYRQRGQEPILIPLLQGGNEEVNTTPYTNTQIAAQIETAEKSGSTEYILHSTNGEYLLN